MIRKYFFSEEFGRNVIWLMLSGFFLKIGAKENILGQIIMPKDHYLFNLDEKKGTIEVESGATLDSINKKTIPIGLILDCSPGCKYVSVGGMISNNISGKLSQYNSISNKIISINW